MGKLLRPFLGLATAIFGAGLLSVPIQARAAETSSLTPAAPAAAESDGSAQTAPATAPPKSDAKSASTTGELPQRRSLRLYKLTPQAHQQRLLMDLPDFRCQRGPAYSRDGKWIFSDVCVMKPSSGNTTVYVATADGSNPRPLIDGTQPSPSPKGNRVAVHRNGRERGVWIVDVIDPQSAVCLDPEGSYPSWAPNGKQIVYTNSQNGRPNLMVVDLVEGENRQLFSDAFPCPYFQIVKGTEWSADGKTILIHGFRQGMGNGSADSKSLGRDGVVSELALVDARGATNGFQVVHQGTIKTFAWDLSQDRIVLSRYSPPHHKHLLWEMPAKGPYTPVLLKEQDVSINFEEVAFSPDGETIVASFKASEPDESEAAKTLGK